MSLDRRRFVKAAGLAALGWTVAPPLKLFGSENNTGTLNIRSTPNEEVLNEIYAASESAPIELPPRAARPPEQASRWAMVIDLHKCREHQDCTACIQACHTVHNVPNYPNPKDEIKWIWKEPFSHAFAEDQHPFIREEILHSSALLLCNHCDNPPCVRVCPTQATWKREKDGIVMMDWHRCIGCRYCIAACPYGSRSFNYREPKRFFAEIGLKPQPDFPMRTRGVVEKCTLCEERLARGQWPACVEACPHNAMIFGDLDNADDPVRQLLAARFTIRRKAGLGTQPEVYYIV